MIFLFLSFHHRITNTIEKKMENIKNFVNGITGNDNQQQKSDGLKNQSVPRVDGNNIKHFGTVDKARNRTESESSSASMSSVSSATSVTNTTQKDKDPYFWVM